MTREELSQGRKKKTYFDYTLLFWVLALVIVGIVMLASISTYNAAKYYSDPFLFVKNQVKYAILSLVAMLVVALLPSYERLMDNRIGQVLLNIAFYVMLPIQGIVLWLGKSTNGSMRWLSIGGFTLQPSEFAKLFTILMAAYCAAKYTNRFDGFWGFFYNYLKFVVLVGLVAVENLSTAIIIAGIALICCFVVSKKKKYYIVIAILAVIGIAIAIFAKGYRSDRFDNWLNVETAPDAMQIREGLFAIVSGGLFGKGLGNGIQKLGYIPEVHTDMIFACIIEELGFVGALCIIGIFVVILWRIFQIGVHAKDLFGGLICCGVMTQIAMQVLINIAVVTNSMPATGIPMPFISYGGSSLLSSFIGIGFVLNVARRIDYEKENLRR